MKKLPSVKDLTVKKKTVLLRTDYDVPLKRQKAKAKSQTLEVAETTRIEESLPTINYLLEQQAKVIIISHLGRPEGKKISDLSLKPVADFLNSKLSRKVRSCFAGQFKIKNFSGFKIANNLFLLENIRFWPGEEKNDLNFAQNLASLGDFYVNDAFACAHRQHASVVGLPKFLPSAFGFDFLKEIEILSKIRNNSSRPVVAIFGGAKEDKLEVLAEFLKWVDFVLIGGKLPVLINDLKFKIANLEKVFVADLNLEGKDITLESAEKFKKIIAKAKTIIWAGPMGVFENSLYELGTKMIAQAIVNSKAYTVIGGGDTETALTKFALDKKVDYISSGGGAMLEFLAKGTLPGIEAITKKNFKF
jgi:phosphoglycerate kinase